MGSLRHIDLSSVVAQLSHPAVQAMHAAGLVHRDVKPANIIFAEQEKRFKLIDLGACADLRAGTNYIPDEGIMDPSYCPPEQAKPTHIAFNSLFQHCRLNARKSKSSSLSSWPDLIAGSIVVFESSARCSGDPIESDL